jgi:hypothetical protein
MKSCLALAVVVLLGAVQGPVFAGTTCDSYPDAIFCDDFDSYCKDPGPYTPCTTSGVSLPKLYYIWPKTSLNYRTMASCGADFDIEENQQILVSVPYGGRINDMGDEAGELGQATRSIVDPIILGVIGGQVSKGLGIRGKWGVQYDQLAGTDESPIVLNFQMSSGTKSAAGLRLSDGIVELALEENEAKKSAYLDPEVAPTDYIMVGAAENATCLSCRSQCAAILAARGIADDGRAGHAAWPSVCQSYDARTASSMCPDPANPGGPPIPCGPPYCPETPSDKLHQLLAVGAMAMLDPNPCHCENPVKPGPCSDGNPIPDYTWHGMEVDHLAFFDGWKWRILSSKIFDPVTGVPGVTGYGDFQLTDKYGWVTLTIRTHTVDIAYDSRQWFTYAGDRCTPDKTKNDCVVSIAVTTPGSGYTSPPAVTIAPPTTGRQATAVALVTDGAVTAIQVTDVGTGYAAAPLVTIAPPGEGTQAVAAATLGGSAYLADWVHSEVHGLPRKYLGNFNAVRAGNPPSCELCTQELRDQGVAGCDAAHWDGVSYQCTEWAGTKCHRMSGRTCSGSTSFIDDGSNYVSLDNMLLQGGAPDSASGACCRPDATCTIMKKIDCLAAGGVFRPGVTACEATTCAGACCQPRGVCTQMLANACPGEYHGAGSSCTTANLCCPTPYADWDRDQDVDSDDFAILQKCLTTGGGGLIAGCSCLDHNHDQKIDQEDVLSFIACATGPGIGQASVPPGCVP